MMDHESGRDIGDHIADSIDGILSDKNNRRFIAACFAMAGMLSRPDSGGQAQQAIREADELLAVLDAKPDEPPKETT